MVTGDQLKILEGLLEVVEKKKDELRQYKKNFKKLKGEPLFGVLISLTINNARTT
jgi:hypothetical protein